MFNDIPFSEWFPIRSDFSAPTVPGLIHVRATQNGVPIPIEHPKQADPTGTMYVKACDDIQQFVRWMYADLVDPKARNMHPAAEAYHSFADATEKWPVDGLQVRYVTEEQIKQAEVILNVEYKAPEPQTPRYDELIRVTCEVDEVSSGYWIPDSTRDIQFRLPSRDAAGRVVEALTSHPDLQEIDLRTEVKPGNP